jgi:hypothetical protein
MKLLLDTHTFLRPADPAGDPIVLSVFMAPLQILTLSQFDI